jgi:hypothetical protein
MKKKAGRTDLREVDIAELDGLDRGPYVDGFNRRTVLGALFVALVMMPGAIYMGLVAGQSLGAAAEWVTIILFAELARRSFTQLKRQEVYVLFYVAAGIASVVLVHLALSGGPFAHAVWHQYLKQAPETSTISSEIPDWVVPEADSPALQERSLVHRDWWWSGSKGLLSPILLIAAGYVVFRLGFFGLGYLLFRLTSDRERLPFPMARVGAEGATALAESTERLIEGGRPDSWRRRVFSVGACVGIIFGSIYVLLPVVTGLFLSKPIMLLPIPFVDFTPNVEGFLPASMVSISFDAAIFMIGMLLPFRMVLGTFTAMVLSNFVLGPVLARAGVFEHWRPGNSLLVNQMVLSFDFWMSVAIGMAGAVLLVGLWSLVRTITKRGRERGVAEVESAEQQRLRRADPNEPPYRSPSRQRGDYPVWLAAALFLGGTLLTCLICRKLVPGFPFWIILVFGFVWTPIHSYISARMIGLTGRGLATPFLRETVFMLSGYRKVDIWFAPVPLHDFGGAAQRFRALELTRTRFSSVIKAELLMLPIILISSFLFWWFFWKLSQIPSSSFPYAARIWPVAARQAYLIFTANSEKSPLLLQAIDPRVIAGAGGVGLAIYALLSVFGLPVQFFYGLIGGIGVPTHVGINIMLGALVGRYYFRRKFGKERWGRFVPVVVAGFTCGAGLAGMTAVAISLVVNCVRELPF